MLNRKIGPRITNDFNLRIGNVSSLKLANGLELYELNTGTQSIVKLELVFRTGRIHEKKPAISKAAIKLLSESGRKYNAEELAYFFDYHGAVFKSETGMEYSSVSLVCLTQHFEKLWPVWLETVLKPLYNADELEKYRSLASRKLKEQLSKNDVIAYRSFTENLFGAQHPYGYNTEPEDIEALQVQDLDNYYRENCGLANAFFVVSGQYTEKIKQQIITSLLECDPGIASPTLEFPDVETTRGEHRIKIGNSSQTSIKTGQLWVDRRHPDYVALRFLNTVLGGYFGSRLMKNIREEKGYTYGIYSSFDAWKNGGYFYISTDVGNEYIDRTISEILKEIQILKTNEIPDIELKMVKNYLLGQSLNLLDGPFATAQLVKSLRAKDLDLGLFEDAVSQIKTLDAKRLRRLANEYLRPEEFTSVLVA